MSASTSSSIKTFSDLSAHYGNYIATINSLPSTKLDPYLANSVNHNDRTLSREEYTKLIIPGSTFTIIDTVVDVNKKQIAAKLDITLEDKKKVKEIVVYALDDEWRIERVWSVVEFS
ncbi:uncharacterized protein IL334_006523 [Kwoniella shivajii]|uniref:Uncharacterized protein n=1 Tax=Kwoniella shivajii TaxID=564305 RepID=A0ABZ1D660_9TREE|nr:hypothetical protein IL334_006523 [Kwoniella shivajii]